MGKERASSQYISWRHKLRLVLIVLPPMLGTMGLNIWRPPNIYDTFTGCHDCLNAIAMGADHVGWAIQVSSYADNPGRSILHYHDDRWQWEPIPDSIVALSANATGGAWAVGQSGIIWRFDGTHWRIVIPTNQSNQIYTSQIPLNLLFFASISVDANGDGWILGSSVYQVRAGVVIPTADYHDNFTVVRTIDAREAWAVGDGVYHAIDGVWTKAKATSVLLLSLDLIGPDEGWAVGRNGAIYHDVGGAWSVVTSPTTADLTWVGMVGPNDGYAIGIDTSVVGKTDTGVLLHYDGTAWTIDHHVQSTKFESLGTTPNGDVWLSADNGMLWRRHNMQWTSWHVPIQPDPYPAVRQAQLALFLWGGIGCCIVFFNPAFTLPGEQRYYWLWRLVMALFLSVIIVALFVLIGPYASQAGLTEPYVAATPIMLIGAISLSLVSVLMVINAVHESKETWEMYRLARRKRGDRS